MYPWVTHTWNPVKGKCPHDCVYCYMKRPGQVQAALHLDEKCLKDCLGTGRTIFVGSSTDMWANESRDGWIDKVLKYCAQWPENTYLFQTKNPARFEDFAKSMPPLVMLGITLESNRSFSESKAPLPRDRYYSFKENPYRKMVSIEPVMNFDLDILTEWLKALQPEFVSIGADSKKHGLTEPPPEKLRSLINNLQTFTEVKLKDNLNRIIGAAK